MKRITLNIDDLGLSEPINQAVVELSNQKIIQACSFMSLGQTRPSDIQQLQANQTDIGLHLDFTELQKEGSLQQVLLKSMQRAWRADFLQTKIRQQFAEFENKIGAIPAFIDGHQHVHQFPQIRQALLDVTLERYHQKIPIRSTKPLINDFKSNTIYYLGGHKFQSILRQQNWGHNPVFAGAYNFKLSQAQLLAQWRNWLQAAPASGLLIMCHPATPDCHWSDAIKDAREIEWALFNSAEFAQLWQALQCSPQPWSDFNSPSTTCVGN